MVKDWRQYKYVEERYVWVLGSTTEGVARYKGALVGR
jgi:hypothetical protein